VVELLRDSLHSLVDDDDDDDDDDGTYGKIFEEWDQKELVLDKIYANKGACQNSDARPLAVPSRAFGSAKAGLRSEGHGGHRREGGGRRASVMGQPAVWPGASLISAGRQPATAQFEIARTALLYQPYQGDQTPPEPSWNITRW
jgi:hypothetical protein